MSYRYPGEELDVFAHAVNWKRYVRAIVRPYLVGDVLEVGAGIGSTTRVLIDGRQRSWTCLEPDPELAARLRAGLEHASHSTLPQVIVGGTRELPPVAAYDAVLYIDVLEHIEHDRDEMRIAAALLKPGGALLALSPAHQWLFSPFDARIGHVRRYNPRLYRDLTPGGTRLEMLRYVDSAGLIASTANRIWLHSDTPSIEQIRFWDRILVRVSRVTDPLLAWRVGKSLIGVWRRE